MGLEDDAAYVYPLTSSYCLLSVDCMQTPGPIVQSIQQSRTHLWQVLTLYAWLQCRAVWSSALFMRISAGRHLYRINRGLITIYIPTRSTQLAFSLSQRSWRTHLILITLVWHAPRCYELAGSMPISCSKIAQSVQTADSRSSYLPRKHPHHWPPSSQVAVCRDYQPDLLSTVTGTDQLLSIWPLGGYTPSVLEGDIATARKSSA